MSKSLSTARWLICLVSLVVAVLVQPQLAQADKLPDLILVKQPGLSPEGIEWDANGKHFLLSSIAEGTVYSVTDDGTTEAFVKDANLKASIGLQVDVERNRLLVCNSDPIVFSDPSASGDIALGIYDLTTGKRLQWVSLTDVAPTGRHFANDVAIGKEGNAYVTDTFSPVIYKVDLEGKASVFAKDEHFSSKAAGLNGIVYHPDGYLLAAVSDEGTLYKIPLDAPDKPVAVKLEKALGFDGMLLLDNGLLVGVSVGQTPTIYQLKSTDHWASASIVASAPNSPASTVTVRDGEVYAIYPHFSDPTPPDAYEIVRVVFGK